MLTMVVMKMSGTKLQRLREQRFWSRAELAEKADVHADHIGRIEREETTRPRMATIRKLAAALEVDPSELVEEE
jgi:transcriptional regulator with XRE-family HTH domain